jgi:phenylpropionate dioxygenase-like ring-hydroxylating dioxygenase large terminal subunit
MGANLGRGQVLDETIQCPFHHWRFSCDGRCEQIPGGHEIPSFARQRSYPAVQRHGFVYFFNAAVALFPLPFFDDELPEHFTPARLFSLTARAPWFMVTAQGFDRQHFETVHDRRLLGPPQVDTPMPFVRRNRWRARIIGRSLRDRILRTLVGDTVTLTINNWGGALFLVRAEFPRACSRFLVSFRPREDGRTHFEVVVFARRGLPALTLAARRWFTRGHLLAEANMIQDTQYRPARLISADADMLECLRWLAGLEQYADGEAQRRGSFICPVDQHHQNSART